MHSGNQQTSTLQASKETRVADRANPDDSAATAHLLSSHQRSLTRAQSDLLDTIITIEAQQALVGYFFTNLAPCVPIFDSRYASLAFLREASPLLLSVMCMVASRTSEPELSGQLLQVSLQLQAEETTSILMQASVNLLHHMQAVLLLAAFPPKSANPTSPVAGRATWSWLLFGQVSFYSAGPHSRLS